MLLLDVIGFDHYKDDNSDDYEERYEGEQLLVLSLDSGQAPLICGRKGKAPGERKGLRSLCMTGATTGSTGAATCSNVAVSGSTGPILL